MLDKRSIISPQGLRAIMNEAYRCDELTAVQILREFATLTPQQTESIHNLASELVTKVRSARKKNTGIDSFLTQYSLSSEEGIVLMCLAEALLRVPDQATIDSLLKDKLVNVNWSTHRGQSDSFLVNAATWALMLTGKVLSPEKSESVLSNVFMTIVNRSSESVIRKATDSAMRIMSKQFVMGKNIQTALNRARKKEALGYRYSYDMLGEAAITAADAEQYFAAYSGAIDAIGMSSQEQSVSSRPGVSIKLSALHPRYQEARHDQVIHELTPKLLQLAEKAKKYDIGIMIDAEESERLDLSLDIIEKVFKDDCLDGWNGFGLAVQSYQKRAFYLIDWIAEIARAKNRRITLRLIKGAYWDSEIKKCQILGLSEYPVFTRKVFTDVSFQACAKKILSLTDAIYPQFATHNAYSVALILELAGDYRDFEFQCLHGMGKELYEQIVPIKDYGIPCRIYAPVGNHKDLLPYLVRRLLENGANSSFVNRIAADSAPIEELIADPVAKSALYLDKINANIPLPRDIFLPERINSVGIDFSNRNCLSHLRQSLSEIQLCAWQATPILAQQSSMLGCKKEIYSPQLITKVIGHVVESTEDDVELSLRNATQLAIAWSQVPVLERAACLVKLGDLLEKNTLQLLAMVCFEAGKTIPDALNEIREAVDFCRYYAVQAERLLSAPMHLHGYTGESNELTLHPRGVAVCISPWNFPLAIFIGQIVAALVTGNCVIAKPAEQTPLIAHFAIQLMLEAGIPAGVVQCLPGSGEVIGAALVADKRVKAVIFTGSTQTAASINQVLASRGKEIIPLIAETGGLNAMIVDSSALLEQAALDIITSAFGSAGQRCSSLRVLYIQEEVYPRLITLLKGAMAELVVGNPQWLVTDIGPVIDQQSLNVLQKHVDAMIVDNKLIYQCELSEDAAGGYFMPPTLIEINSISVLKQEVFGPILHVMAFKQDSLEQVVAEISQTGFGLTLGIHSRINSTVQYIRDRVHVGNCYVNRNMIGAVVGVQPFGGEGLSGTGPKAGGPNYLFRLCHERTLSIDTTAAGGNASLLSIPD